MGAKTILLIGAMLALLASGCRPAESGPRPGSDETRESAANRTSDPMRMGAEKMAAENPADQPRHTASSEKPAPAPAPAPAPSPPPAPARTSTPSGGVSPASPTSLPAPSAEPKKTRATPKPKQPTAGKERPAVSQSQDRKLSMTELRRKYPDVLRFTGPSNKRWVALTFDDAPDGRFTPQVLDILQQYQVKATFFVIGYRAVGEPELLKRIVREGHAVGNHTYGHSYLPKLSLSRFEREIAKNENVIRNITGLTPHLFRPPYGAITEAQIRWSAEHHLQVVNWDVDSKDWTGIDAKTVAANILPHIHSGAIVLQHSGTGKGGDISGTVEALPGLIESLQKKGYKLVTLPELLGVSAYQQG